MTPAPPPEPSPEASPAPHQRRLRYVGKNPRHFADKYKEHDPTLHAATVAKVLAAGKTVAGTHRPIMVAEILVALAPRAGDTAVDCTLGYGGHTQALLAAILPGGRLLGLDADPIELPKTEARLRALGFSATVFTAHHTNFAGLPRILAGAGLPGADVILADLGVSSMQIDDPARGFSVKLDGPLDMRMNPRHGPSAADWLARTSAKMLARALTDHADEPDAVALADLLAGRRFTHTGALAEAIRLAQPDGNADALDLTVRRVFQTLRIAVNDEFSALDSWLRQLPACLNPGGRVAVLTFHSGEDRRVKKAFAAGLRDGHYAAVADTVTRAEAAERHANPRSVSAKLRWAVRTGVDPVDSP